MLSKDSGLRPTAADIERQLTALAALTSGATAPCDAARPPARESAVQAPSGAHRPTVGREAELDLLREAFAAAAAGSGSLRCVAGEPGIGKTTLVDRFLAGLSGQPDERVAIGRGRCSERLAGSEAYLSVLEAVEGLLRADPTGATARALRLLAPTWHAQIAAADVSGAPGDHTVAISQDRLKRELLAFLSEVTRIRPCVIFLDDLHWADLSTVDLLAYLGGRCVGLRLLMILTYRPSDLVLAKNPLLTVRQELEARGVCREIALPFLSDDEIGRYLAAEFRGHVFPSDFSSFLLTKTSGNPLFLVDLLRYLREGGVIARDGAGAWSLARPVPEFQRELPQSVRSMVQRKVDELSEADRRLLMAASVRGNEFEAAVIARALGQDAAEVEDRLAALDRLHAVVKQRGEVELPDQTLTTRYAFVHVLYQNAIFASLQPARKASVAAAVAAAVQSAYATHPEPVAAQLASSSRRPAISPAAADHYLHAAENARRLFAQREAASLARRGLDLITRLPAGAARVTLEIRLAMALGIALESVAGAGNAEVKQAFARHVN
jgi:predicted ATPase